MVTAMAFVFSACGSESSEPVDNSPITESEIAELYTDADSFAGRTYEFTGQVLKVEKDGEDLYLQVYQDIKNYEHNTVVKYLGADSSFNEDDYVRVSGTIDGSFSGENAFGGEVDAPLMTADKVEKIEATEAFPAEKTVEVGETVEKGDYKVTLSKVDYTNDETRIYLKVENNSSSVFDNYPDQGVIVQDGKQHETEWSDYYPEPSNELKPGASSESVIVFKGIEQSDFTYSFTGYNDDDYDELEFSFDVKVE